MRVLSCRGLYSTITAWTRPRIPRSATFIDVASASIPCGWIPVALSREPELLRTGGGLKNAAPLLAGGEPFFIHNVNVLSAIDLGALYARHKEGGALATLAVQPRAAGRLAVGSGRTLGRVGRGSRRPAAEGRLLV